MLEKEKNIAKFFYTKYLSNKINRFSKNNPFLIIVMYHGISPERVPGSTKLEDFENGLIWMLENGFENYDLEELIKSDFNFIHKGFIITFDDAEKNVIKYAIPILKKYNLKATLFPSTMLIGKKYGFSWEKIPKSIISIEEIGKYHGYIKEIMDREDIEYWLNNGFKIGSHGLRHTDLSSISLFPELLEEEVVISKQILENLFGIKIESFCYPFGSFNSIVEKEVRKYYKCALTVNRGIILNSENISLYELPRIGGGNSFGFAFNMYKMIYRDKKERGKHAWT